MFHLFRVWFSVVTFSLVLSVYNFANAADFSGTWQGPYYYNPEAYGQPGSLTVTITQSGDSISGTFVASTGDTGSFTGQAYSDYFTGSWERPVGPFTSEGNFLARLQHDVLVWDGIGYLIEDTDTISGALTKNWVTNVSHWLNVTKNYFPSGSSIGDIWCSLSEPPGKSINSAVMVTPRCNTISVNEWDVKENRYEGSYYYDVANVENAYPNGIYTFSFQFEDGSKGACFSALSGSFPTKIPEITNPLPDSEVNESLPLPVNWNAWLNPGVYNDISIYFNIDHFQSLPSSQTAYELPSNTIPDNYLESFSVGFNRPSGYYAERAVDSHSYIRTTSHKVDDYWCAKVKLKLPSGAFAGVLIVGMDVSGITGATLIPPAGASGSVILLSHAKEQLEKWEGGARFAAFADFETSYPDGIYILRVNYSDATQEDITISLNGDYPSEMPAISQPVHLSHLDWWEGFSASWPAWPQFNDPGNFIVTFLDVITTATVDALLSSEEVWNDNEVGAGGANVPHGVLASGKIYAYQVLFVQEVNPGAMKATANVVFVNTSEMPPSRLSIALAGDGQGKVVTNDGRINCNGPAGDCQAEYYQKQMPVLLAVPDVGSYFSGWSGDADCVDNVVSMTQSRSCTAQFTSKNCPPCSGDKVSVQNVTFYSGTDCNCRATTSITTGPGVTIEADATVNFVAPQITIGAGTTINKGASVNTYTNW